MAFGDNLFVDVPLSESELAPATAYSVRIAPVALAVRAHLRLEVLSARVAAALVAR